MEVEGRAASPSVESAFEMSRGQPCRLSTGPEVQVGTGTTLPTTGGGALLPKRPDRCELRSAGTLLLLLMTGAPKRQEALLSLIQGARQSSSAAAWCRCCSSSPPVQESSAADVFGLRGGDGDKTCPGKIQPRDPTQAVVEGLRNLLVWLRVYRLWGDFEGADADSVHRLLRRLVSANLVAAWKPTESQA
mmetsp:Transcript_63372/g.151234  ORF Transcript_63372/g.151234 Transcript_63372/m.151234 type:complete len:190 (-) Transcript_63372:190-759(-)